MTEMGEIKLTHDLMFDRTEDIIQRGKIHQSTEFEGRKSQHLPTFFGYCFLGLVDERVCDVLDGNRIFVGRPFDGLRDLN